MRKQVTTLVSILAVVPLVAPVRAAPPDPMLQNGRRAVARGIDYMHRTQETDGSWGHYPATTALALSGLLRNGKSETNDPAVAKGVQFLVRAAQTNGSICSKANPAIELPNYNTCLAVMALIQTGNPVYRPTIRKALNYLEKVQFDEEDGIRPSNPLYGGIGYGDDPGDDTHPDLSNLQFALEALHEGGTPASAPVFKKALIFLQRVQNRRESNDQSWVKQGPNDGGFVYTSQGGAPADEGGASPKHSSYGSMTYAGLKSYIYAGVTRSDPRAQAAWNWIRGHYTVAEHPGMGSTSLYYYYHTMAKTLDVFGRKIVKDTKGSTHDWARDLTGALVAAQHPDGSWSNTNARYWENQPGLVTSYSLITLSYCLHGK